MRHHLWSLAMMAGLGLSLAGPSPIVADENPLGLPTGAVTNGGTLLICGGGATPDEVYDEFIQAAGGAKARIVHIPSAHQYPSREYVEQRFSKWRDFALESLEFLDPNSREEADSADAIDSLDKATGVWFSGGYQGRLADLFRGTEAQAAIRRVIERGGAIGGTSAGAAIMSDVMIRHGNPQAVVDRGLGLVQTAVVDQHFSERRRYDRLRGVIEEHPQLLGLGVDEGTALIVRGGHVRVVGRSGVTLCARHSKGEVKVQKLRSGDEADLSWQPTQDDTPPLLELRPVAGPSNLSGGGR